MSNLNSKRIKNEKKNSFKFKVGDFVRISRARKTFTREYDQRWSGELFQIVNRDGIPHTQRYPTYKIKDYAGSPLMEHFMKKSYRRSLPVSIIRWKKF